MVRQVRIGWNEDTTDISHLVEPKNCWDFDETDPQEIWEPRHTNAQRPLRARCLRTSKPKKRAATLQRNS